MNRREGSNIRRLIVCVTGFSGMVGRKIVSNLRGQDVELRVLSRVSVATEKGVQSFIGDLSDINLLEKFLSNADCLFHCAGEINDTSKMYSTNVEGTRNLFDVIVGQSLSYFCFISSAGVIGTVDAEWVSEESRCNPQNHYERTKLKGEEIVKHKIPNCTTIILRPINIVDNENPGAFALPLRGSIRDRFNVLVKGGECAHVVHSQTVAECAIYFMDRKLEKPEVFFVGMDEDEANTFRGIWNSVRSVGPRRQRTIHWNLPVWVPHIIRKVRGLRSNFGRVKYSSKKVRSFGFVSDLDIDKMSRGFLHREK